MKTVAVFFSHIATIVFSLDKFCAYIERLEKAFMYDKDI